MPPLRGEDRETSSPLGSQKKPTAEPQDQKVDDWESMVLVEPADLLVSAVPREELFLFLESTLFSGSKVKLTLDDWGDFHQVLSAVRTLSGESKGPRQHNAKNYQQALCFHNALYG